MNTDIALRQTVSEICGARDRALEIYTNAYEILERGNDMVNQAAAEASKATAGRNQYNAHLEGKAKAFESAIKLPDRETYLAGAKTIIDTSAWARIIEMTKLERAMDTQGKKELRQSLIQDAPELTVDNVHATLNKFLAEADTFWRRGLANSFSNLDKRFKSHDGWKIGSRVILDNALDEWGCWNYYRDKRDTLMDIERSFFIVDGEEVPETYAGIVGTLEAAVREARQTRAYPVVVESDYFRVRAFKNGNLHIWMTRDDLVARVNRELGIYYGEVIPKDRDDEDREPDIFEQRKTTPAKNYGFFPTPDLVARGMFRDNSGHTGTDQPPLCILEPSAGGGNIARIAAMGYEESGDMKGWREDYGYGNDQRKWDNVVDCIEVQQHLAHQLSSSGIYNSVLQADFLNVDPNCRPYLYDRIYMNPPFDRERDIDHVTHALKFLKPGGILVAIMSAGTELRETKKARAFRKLISERGTSRDLPAGSFSEVGTNINTIMVTLYRKDD